MNSMARNDSMRKRVTLAISFTFGCVLLGLLGLASANLFPDQTWRAFNTARTTYDGIVSRLTPMPTGTDRNVQEFRIYESLVRDFIRSNPSNPRIFLSVDNSDPSDELIGRFTASGVVVKRASEAHFDTTKSVWTDHSTGSEAVRIDVGSIRWILGDRVEVKGGLSCGMLCGIGGIYQLVTTHGRWTVAGCRDRWVS